MYDLKDLIGSLQDLFGGGVTEVAKNKEGNGSTVNINSEPCFALISVGGPKYISDIDVEKLTAVIIRRAIHDLEGTQSLDTVPIKEVIEAPVDSLKEYQGKAVSKELYESIQEVLRLASVKAHELIGHLSAMKERICSTLTPCLSFEVDMDKSTKGEGVYSVGRRGYGSDDFLLLLKNEETQEWTVLDIFWEKLILIMMNRAKDIIEEETGDEINLDECLMGDEQIISRALSFAKLRLDTILFNEIPLESIKDIVEDGVEKCVKIIKANRYRPNKK